MGSDDLICFNCDRPLSQPRRPYLFCSERCAEEAHTVRYARRVIRDGRILDPLVAEAVKIRIGMVLGGGYAKSGRRLGAELRQQIFERDGGRCQICGGEATQIDHINEDLELIARDINDPENLQAICDECHREKTLSTFIPLEPEHQAHAAFLNARIHSPLPLRPSDDDQNWKTDWRRFAAERTAFVRSLSPTD